MRCLDRIAPPAPSDRLLLVLENRQRERRLDRRRIQSLVAAVLAEKGQDGELGILFVTPGESAELNRQFLGHEGPTDVITFDHGSTSSRLHGEMFICVAEAVRQAREFQSTWESEVLRYVIHGLLHLRGFDDQEAADRRRMKREEERLLRTLVR